MVYKSSFAPRPQSFPSHHAFSRAKRASFLPFSVPHPVKKSPPIKRRSNGNAIVNSLAPSAVLPPPIPHPRGHRLAPARSTRPSAAPMDYARQSATSMECDSELAPPMECVPLFGAAHRFPRGAALPMGHALQSATSMECDQGLAPPMECVPLFGAVHGFPRGAALPMDSGPNR